MIEASWDALVDSLEAGMVRSRAPHGVIPLAQPVLGEEEERAVLEVLRSGQLSLGPRVPAFEQAFAARVGARHASAVSSGTAALHLGLRAVGVSDGRRGRHLAVLVRGVGQRDPLRGRDGRCSPTSTRSR